MSRGILWITWGTQDGLLRSVQSAQKWHPELPRKVVKLDSATLLDKAQMFDLSPFDETLFLDADTVIMGKLDHGFEMAKRHGLACCICECPWARRFGGLSDRGDIQEYNTGVIYWTRQAAPVFDAWKRLAGIDSSLKFKGIGGERTMPHNDQAGFAAAIDETGFNPFVLPLNWNLRARWQKSIFGAVRIWHGYDDVPDALYTWNAKQDLAGAVIECARLA